MEKLNHIKVRGLFRTLYMYLDVQYEDGSYEVDKFIPYDLYFRLRFINKEYANSFYKYRFCLVKVKHRDIPRFDEVMKRLNNSLLIKGGQEYKDVLDSFNDAIDRMNGMEVPI